MNGKIIQRQFDRSAVMYGTERPHGLPFRRPARTRIAHASIATLANHRGTSGYHGIFGPSFKVYNSLTHSIRGNLQWKAKGSLHWAHLHQRLERSNASHTMVTPIASMTNIDFLGRGGLDVLIGGFTKGRSDHRIVQHLNNRTQVMQIEPG